MHRASIVLLLASCASPPPRAPSARPVAHWQTAAAVAAQAHDHAASRRAACAIADLTPASSSAQRDCANWLRSVDPAAAAARYDLAWRTAQNDADRFAVIDRVGEAGVPPDVIARYRVEQARQTAEARAQRHRAMLDAMAHDYAKQELIDREARAQARIEPATCATRASWPQAECRSAYGTSACGYHCVAEYGAIDCAHTPFGACIAAAGVIKCWDPAPAIVEHACTITPAICLDAYGTSACGYGCVAAYGEIRCAATPTGTCTGAAGDIRCVD